MANPRTSTPPMRPADFLALLVLADGPLHGYGLAQRIAEETAGRVQLVPGNLYAVLQRLLDEGLIRETERRPAPDLDDARRRYYELTDDGLDTVREEALQIEKLVRGARRRGLFRGVETSR